MQDRQRPVSGLGWEREGAITQVGGGVGQCNLFGLDMSPVSGGLAVMAAPREPVNCLAAQIGASMSCQHGLMNQVYPPKFTLGRRLIYQELNSH